MFPRNTIIASPPTGRLNSQSGAALIFFIFAIVILGVLLSAMASMFRTAVRDVTTPNYSRRSHYMAESGVRYALSELRESDDIVATIQDLNNGTYPLGDDSFDLDVSTLGMLQAQEDITPGVHVGVFSTEMGGLPEDFCDLVPDKDADTSISQDLLHLVAADAVGKPNELEFVQVDHCTYMGGGVVDFDLQNMMYVLESEFVYMAASFDDSPSDNYAPGDTVKVGWAARRFPPNQGACYVYDQHQKKEVEVFYDRIYCDDANFDCWMELSVNQPAPGDWPLFGLSQDTYFVLNTNNYGNYWITAVGFAGPSDSDTVITLNAVAANYLGGLDGPDEDPDHAPYILSMGGGWPTDEEKYGEEGTEYEGVFMDDDTRLDQDTLADIDGDLTLESGTTNPGAEELNTVARYGDNTMTAGDFYADLGTDYEIAVRSGVGAVISSADFHYTNLETYHFYLSYNLNSDYELFWRYGNTSTGYVAIADPANDPDHDQPLYLAPPSGLTRYLGNFWIHAKGEVQNHNRYFRTRVNDLMVYYDGLPWPGTVWQANTEYEDATTTLDYVIPVTDSWNATQAYALDDLVWPTTPNGFTYRCTTAGVADATEPASWPRNEGDTVTDGTVTWTAERGLVYRCTVPGTSGAAEPVWPTARGATVIDGTVEWTCGIPNFESGDTYTYLISQQDEASSSLEVLGDFQMVWNNKTSLDYGLQFYLQLHDVAP